MALRPVWRPAAIMVIGIHTHDKSLKMIPYVLNEYFLRNHTENECLPIGKRASIHSVLIELNSIIKKKISFDMYFFVENN